MGDCEARVPCARPGPTLTGLRRPLAGRTGGAAPGESRGFAFDWAGLMLFALFVGPALLALDFARRLSPGGLAEMSLIALALKIEVAFVAAMHVIRVFLVMVLAGRIFSLIGNRPPDGPPADSASGS